MKILVFTEGTILMHLFGKDVSREERVKQSQAAGIQREERNLAYNNNLPPPAVKKGSIYDLASYIPIGAAINKLLSWQKQGATICYLTSRRIKSEIKTIKQVLEKYNFPNASSLFYRQQGEEYHQVAERIRPDILIEDDCQSIGGREEMVSPYIRPALKKRMTIIIVKEFAGIDNLTDKIEKLKNEKN